MAYPIPEAENSAEAAFSKSYSSMGTFQKHRGRLLLERVEVADGATVLDLGCGTGAMIRDLQKAVGASGRVIGIDPDAWRLQLARAGIDQEAAAVRFIEAVATDLRGVADETVDLVFSNYVLHWVLDIPAMLAELFRVLRPGGQFVCKCVGDPIPETVEMFSLVPGGAKVASERTFLTDAQWRHHFTNSGLSLEWIDRVAALVDFPDLNTAFSWLASSSNGGFDPAKLDTADRQWLEAKYAAQVTFSINEVEFLLTKPAGINQRP
ncbi:class I SAM-dependent methyltransferase [Roseibium sp. RKSG952]|uniref:class I SAM-dependent methyltransferase n=1 Tax=Roseibium sp. RKSG952 TaxID=2529384 RepID=UPI0012BB7114|nr:class I SAM-dependent methyltransferase [Roseibium sp. RKSG952]MTH96779.1 class I SAM-dependent methyltransferase [Roseibium sp. RKSG952]